MKNKLLKHFSDLPYLMYLCDVYFLKMQLNKCHAVYFNIIYIHKSI